MPVVLDDSLAVSLAEGRMKINGVDLTIEDPKTNETITAQSSNLDDVLPTSDEIPATSISSLGNSTVEATSPSADQAESRSDDLPVILMDNPVTPSDELAKKGIVQFNQPFFWYLYDGQIGTALYYGTVNSLATYKKEYGLETDEDHVRQKYNKYWISKYLKEVKQCFCLSCIFLWDHFVEKLSGSLMLTRRFYSTARN